jgi:Ca-activated chloride channel family protein
MSVKPISENWLPADSVTIENTFGSLSDNVIATYSNLPTLIYKGIEYIRSRNNEGSLLLVSDSDQDGDVNVANELVNDLTAMMNNKPVTINIADFTTQSDSYHYIGNQYYYANEYLYYHLARVTKGNYCRMKNSFNTFSELLNNAFQKLDGSIQTFDLYTTMKEGFCYGRYDVNSTSAQPSYSTLPIMQVGRYNGSFPFSIKASGLYRNKGFSTNIELDKSRAFAGDSNTRKAWAGNYIRSLELSGDKSNETISEIIFVSMSNRVLSLYTAFLALEPEMAPKENDEQNSDVRELGTAANIKMSASPNPFSTGTEIKLDLTEGIKTEGMTINIYDMMGNIVKALTPAALVSGSSSVEFNWTGDDDSGRPLPDGTYLLVINTPQGRQVFKLIIMR